MTKDLRDKTVRDFGEQWTLYRSNHGYYGSLNLFEDLVGPLMPIDAIKGKRVADIGSGTGRIVNMLLDAGAAEVVAIEPSRAFDVLKANTSNRSDQITYVNSTGDQLQSGLDLDLIVSMGVIHHIPNPTQVMDAAFSALKPSGTILVWLYGEEGNELYLAFARPVRFLTTRLPHSALKVICEILGVGLDAYVALCRFFPLPMQRYMRNVLRKFPKDIRRLAIYDQLNPTYSQYYTRAEAERLLKDAGFSDVRLWHRHGYSWTVMGKKAG